MRPPAFIVALCLPFAVAAAHAAVLYKLTDRTGHVTYVQAVPKDFEGDVKRLDIDTEPGPDNLNAPHRQGPGAASPPSEPATELAHETTLRAARMRAQAAREAFESARDNSTPDDWVYVGPNNPLGMRRFRKPEYEARLARLADAAKRAEEEVERLEHTP